jgi:hypothetical protein
MAALVTVDQAKDHLRITDDASNADLAVKVDQASAIIVRYLKTQAVAGWTADPPTVTVPGNVEAATLVLLEDLYEHRPIDLKEGSPVWCLLVGMRDPALA